MNMIKRLRRKFLIMAVIGVLVVVGGALGLINAIAYMAHERPGHVRFDLYHP